MKRFVLLSLFFSIFIFSNSIAQTVTQKNVYFESDNFHLDDLNKNFLQSLYEGTTDFTECSIKIIGHTDQDGSHAYNMDLSKKRAESVKHYLVNQGFSNSSIETAFMGETELIHQSHESTLKKENRRVTIIVHGYTYEKVDEMVSQVNLEDNDHHTIEHSLESHLQLKKGTEVTIPSNAFCKMDGSPVTDQKIDVMFKEAFEYSEMVDESLSTQTSDQILETGGMIYIEASQNGEPLKLQEGKSIELLFPEQEVKEGMELFTGVESVDGVIWEETGEAIKSVEAPSENMPFIEVDLSPITDLELDENENMGLTFAPMPPYPHPARIAYPPYKENYSDEDYVEAVKKYEAVMKLHEEDKITRPAKLEAWIEEATRRKDIIIEHKKNYMRSKVIKQLKERLVKLEENKDRISHERLIKVLFAFLDRSIGKVEYNDWYYTKLAFGENVVQAKEHLNFYVPDYKHAMASYFFPEFNMAKRQVEGSIAERKYELGYIDQNTLSRYVVAASQLGWINCDRFYEMAENEKTNLEFARISKGDRYYLIFKNRKSLVIPYDNNEKMIFKGVPKGEDVRLVAVNMWNGNAKMAVHDFVSKANHGVQLKFVPSQISDLKKALEI